MIYNTIKEKNGTVLHVESSKEEWRFGLLPVVYVPADLDFSLGENIGEHQQKKSIKSEFCCTRLLCRVNCLKNTETCICRWKQRSEERFLSFLVVISVAVGWERGTPACLTSPTRGSIPLGKLKSHFCSSLIKRLFSHSEQLKRKESEQMLPTAHHPLWGMRDVGDPFKNLCPDPLFSLVLSWFDDTENSSYSWNSEKGKRPVEEMNKWAQPWEYPIIWKFCVVGGIIFFP